MRNFRTLQPCMTLLTVFFPSQPPLHVPVQTRKFIRVQKVKLKHTRLHQPITPHPNPRVPNKQAPCDPAPRVHIPKNLPTPPPPRVNPIYTAPDCPIARRTTYQTRNSQPPVNLAMQLKQALLVTPSQASETIFSQGPTCPLVNDYNSPSHAGPQHRNRGSNRIPPATAPSQIPKNGNNYIEMN